MWFILLETEKLILCFSVNIIFKVDIFISKESAFQGLSYDLTFSKIEEVGTEKMTKMSLKKLIKSLTVN